MPKIRMLGACILAASLVACGPSTKSNPSLGGGDQGGNGQKQSKNCEGDYNPIGLFVPGLVRMENPNNIPPGTYESTHVEIFVRDQFNPASIRQVHFSEIHIADSTVLQPVCQGGPMSDLGVEYSFPALQSLVVTAQGKTRLDSTYLMQGQNGRFIGSRVNGTTPDDTTGMTGLLAKFTQSSLYQVGPTTYELHGEVRELRAGGYSSRWVLQRFSLVPSAQ